MPSPRPVGNGKRPGRPMTRPVPAGGKKPSIGRKPANSIGRKPAKKKPGGGPVATKKPAPGIGNRPGRITHPTLPKKSTKGGRPLDRAPRDPSRGAKTPRPRY